MNKNNVAYFVEHYYLKDDGVFPNSRLPVLLYKNVLRLPPLFAASYIRALFRKNNWYNAWNYGIFEYHHYHSISHEALGFYRGETMLQLGGRKGIELPVGRGDVLIIPAGVAHRNMGREQQVRCVGAYPNGMAYDINYGHIGERPHTDSNIRKVPPPDTDPVFGRKGGLNKYW